MIRVLIALWIGTAVGFFAHGMCLMGKDDGDG